MPIKFLLFWGGSGPFLKGGWKRQFIFYGRGDFSDLIFVKMAQNAHPSWVHFLSFFASR